jgi:hypothetical protein
MHFWLSGNRNQIISAFTARIQAEIHQRNISDCHENRLQITGHNINHIQNMAQMSHMFFVLSAGFEISLI